MGHSRARKRAKHRAFKDGINVPGFETWRYNGLPDNPVIAQYKRKCRMLGHYGILGELELRVRKRKSV